MAELRQWNVERGAPGLSRRGLLAGSLMLGGSALLPSFGWGGAAGTVAFLNTRVGNRAALYTQYMPSEAYPVHEEFPKAVIADLLAGARP